MKKASIVHGERLAETIREGLRSSLAAESLRASEGCEFYLVNLLTEFHEAGRLPELGDSERPLGVRYMEAVSAPAPARETKLKEIGDSTLIALGLFAESIRSKIVDSSYYVTIGGSAYETLSGVVVCDSLFAAVYAELAEKFAAFVGALARMSPCNQPCSDAQIINIYRRWTETGDQNLAELLRKEGISTERE